VWLCI
jgi:large subunit ribosomal protein LP1